MVHPGKPATLACELICPGDLTGCNIAHHWIAMLKKDNYEVHYLSTTRTRRLSINGDYHVLDYNLSQLGNSLCASGESAVTFSINITHVNPEVEEVLIFCGLRRGQSRAAYSYNPVAAILKPGTGIYMYKPGEFILINGGGVAKQIYLHSAP